MTTALLAVRNLRVEFNTRRGTLVAVDDVSFDIAPGEVLGVVGESGAGKSITGTAIIGLLERPGRVAGGEVLLEGSRIDNLPPDGLRRIRGRKIGAIFQDPLTSLNPLFTIGSQIVETIQAHLPMNGEQARARAIQLLGEVGIPAPERRIDHFPHQFSGGMRQRVVIATLQIGAAIITESSLSFLGVGVPPTQPSLGTLIRIGNDFLFSGEWWITVFPGLALVVLVLAINVLGDWLRDALNPRLR